MNKDITCRIGDFYLLIKRWTCRNRLGLNIVYTKGTHSYRLFLLFIYFNYGSSTCLHTKYSLAVLHENALSLLRLANKNVIEISWITITSGNPTFNSVFALLVITKCYDIIIIYHQSSSISICCAGQGGAVL